MNFETYNLIVKEDSKLWNQTLRSGLKEKIDLSYGFFEHKHFRSFDFSNLNLNNASFRFCSFESCNFKGSNLFSTEFYHCCFSDTNFQESNLKDSDFESCKIIRAKFHNAILSNITIDDTTTIIDSSGLFYEMCPEGSFNCYAINPKDDCIFQVLVQETSLRGTFVGTRMFKVFKCNFLQAFPKSTVNYNCKLKPQDELVDNTFSEKNIYSYFPNENYKEIICFLTKDEAEWFLENKKYLDTN